MNVIWKRPDGFHGATPEDFGIVKISSHSNLWVHKRDKDTFPFRVSGGWEDEAHSIKLNNLINLLADPTANLLQYLEKSFHHSMKDSPAEFCAELYRWLDELSTVVKGDSWEKEIVATAISAVKERIQSVEAEFQAHCE